MNKIVNMQIVVIFQRLLSPSYSYYDTTHEIRKTFSSFGNVNPQFLQSNQEMQLPPEVPRFVFQSPTGGSIQMSQQSITFSIPESILCDDGLLDKLNENIYSVSTFIFNLELGVTVRMGIVLNGVKSREKMLDTIKTYIDPRKQIEFTTEESEIAFLKKSDSNGIILNHWNRFSYNAKQSEQFYLHDFNTDQENQIRIESKQTLLDLYKNNFEQIIREACNE